MPRSQNCMSMDMRIFSPILINLYIYCDHMQRTYKTEKRINQWPPLLIHDFLLINNTEYDMTPSFQCDQDVNKFDHCIWNSKWLQLSTPGGCRKNAFQALTFGCNDGILWAIMLCIFVIHHNLCYRQKICCMASHNGMKKHLQTACASGQ